MSNPNQLFLLADHIKLSLLERQRAQSLNLGGDSQDGHISRSLEQFRDGIAALKEEQGRTEDSDSASSAIPAVVESITSLQKQFDSLTAQFHGFSNATTNEVINQPNDASLSADFAHAASTVSQVYNDSSNRKSKSVRFSDSPPSPSQQLFGRYRDEPSVRDDTTGYANHQTGLSNQQVHEHHSQILEEQDEHLDRLGESIGRQRELSMQIGDELDSHVVLLDEVEAVTDRQQSRLDRASRSLGKIARSASENKQMTAIFVLIVVLVLLIAILK